MDGRCDFCPRAGRLARCVCVHEHMVGVWVCPEKHEKDLGTDDISCRVCTYDVPYERRHWCRLYEIADPATYQVAAYLAED